MSDQRLQDHWSSGTLCYVQIRISCLLLTPNNPTVYPYPTCDKDKYILWLLVSGPISKWTFVFSIVIVCSVARNGISFVTAYLIYMYEDVDFMEFGYVL